MRFGTGCGDVRRCGLVALLLLCGVVAAGCGGGAKATITPPPQPPAPGQAPPVAQQSGNVVVSPQYVALGVGKAAAFHATAGAGEQLIWLVNGVQGGNATVGTVDAQGNYTAPASLTQSGNVVIEAADAANAKTNYATAVAALLAGSSVTATQNPQVATYSLYLPAPGTVRVDFGPTTEYGLSTWAQATPSPNGGQVNLYVAGMRGQTGYHMRATVTLDDGATYTDGDQTFTTGKPPMTAAVTVTPQNGQVPQPGIEMFDTLLPQEAAHAFATDLQGNVIWTYSYTDGTKMDTVQPVKLLPNGHFLVLVSYASSIALLGVSILPGTVDAVREVDLAGNTIREVTEAQVNAALAAKGYNLTLTSLHHDVLALPNGHWILMSSMFRPYTDLPGYPGVTNVLGDVLVDVDPTGQVAWVWNTFDHLDVNRHPYLFPDWTHSNALLYSADDHDLLLSMRHQNWVVKIDYADGQGSGKILWRLGEGGDFTLQNGVDPTDWFYAQHGPNYFSTNTTGLFQLGIMDNGDNRLYPDGSHCVTGTAASGTPCYSEAEVFTVDETAMTATLKTQYTLPANLYSYFGGDVLQLDNGDLEADFCASAGGSLVQELNLSGSGPQLVWQAVTPNTDQYRVERLPSLYPGVQW